MYRKAKGKDQKNSFPIGSRSLITLRLILLIFFLSLLYSNPSVSKAENDDSLTSFISTSYDGFKDVRWGTHIRDIRDLKYIKHKQTSGGNVKVYRRTDDNLEFEGVKLYAIEYGFLNNKLLFVSLKTRGRKNIEDLENIISSMLGESKFNKDKSHIKQIYWSGNRTEIVFQHQKNLNSSVLLLASKQDISDNY